MALKSKQEYMRIADSLNFNTKAFIDGKFVNGSGGETFKSINPATGRVITEITRCTVDDVNTAVAAARRAFEDRRWAGLAPDERKRRLIRLAELLEAHTDEIAVTETLDSGKPVFDTVQGDLVEAPDCFRFHAEAIDKLNDDVIPYDDRWETVAVREPIGVVAAIVPWNFPLLMAAWKMAPILASGNSVIVKPAKLTSLSILKLAELSLEAGIPEGVINILPGDGSIIGNALALHPDVDLITFTGSTSVGKGLLACSSRSNAKRVLLEMGGKSPGIVLPDIDDYDYVAEQLAYAALWNMGENCTQNSRLLIHRSIKDKLVPKLLEKVEAWTVGDPLDPAARLGPMIEHKHMEEVLNYIRIGKKEGGKLIYGGTPILEETGGYFVKPTVFDNVTPDMTIAREEIFGPVFGILTFDTVDEAIRIANDTSYGLQASIYTNDLNNAHKLSRAVRAGVISVNTFTEGGINTPFGGFKQSGFFGRDNSVMANRQYTEVKSICTYFPK